MADIYAWLIERADPKNSGCVLPNQFLSFVGNTSHPRPAGWFAWGESVQWAIRFARREDAEKFVLAIENLQQQLPHALTITGLRDGDPRAIAVEHCWSDDRVPPVLREHRP